MTIRGKTGRRDDSGLNALRPLFLRLGPLRRIARRNEMQLSWIQCFARGLRYHETGSSSKTNAEWLKRQSHEGRSTNGTVSDSKCVLQWRGEPYETPQNSPNMWHALSGKQSIKQAGRRSIIAEEANRVSSQLA